MWSMCTAAADEWETHTGMKYAPDQYHYIAKLQNGPLINNLK